MEEQDLATYSDSSPPPRVIRSGVWVAPFQRVAARTIVGLLRLLVSGGHVFGSGIGGQREVARLLGGAKDAFPAEARSPLRLDGGGGFYGIYGTVGD